MSLRRHHRGLTVGLLANAAMLAVIAFTLTTRDNSTSLLSGAFAQEQPVIGGGAGLFVTPAQFSKDLFGCYVMDVDEQTISAYQYFPSDRQLRLVAARSFRFDRKLTDFNTDKPSPDDVRQWVEKQQAGIRGVTPPAPSEK